MIALQVLPPPDAPPTPAFLNPYLSTLTTNFPLPPASPILRPNLNPLIVPPPPTSPTASSGSTPTGISLTSLPCLQISPPRSPPMTLSPHRLSPLPNVRRESQCTDFEFPPTLPVPSQFADLEREREARRDSFLSVCSVGDRRGSSSSYVYCHLEDIEVIIKSSTDNLLDVGEDEPLTFEEKSISEIRDSIANSLDTSLDADDMEDYLEGEQEVEGRGERGTPDGQGKNEDDEEEDGEKRGEESTAANGQEEKDSGDSEDTDDTVREKASTSSNESTAHPSSELLKVPVESSEQCESPMLIVPSVESQPLPSLTGAVLESETSESHEFKSTSSIEIVEHDHPVESLSVPIVVPSFENVSIEPADAEDVEILTECSEDIATSSPTFLSLPAERFVEGAESNSDDEKSGTIF